MGRADRDWICGDQLLGFENSEQPNQPSATAADELEVAFQQSCLRDMTIKHELTNQIAKQEQHYKDRLHKQRREIEKLVAMLDQVETIVARLQSSRFWTFANKAAAIEAKLFRNKDFAPDRRLQKTIAEYSRWRASRAQISNGNELAGAAESPVAVKVPIRSQTISRSRKHPETRQTRKAHGTGRSPSAQFSHPSEAA
jgi:hypothetical protein